MSHRHRRGRSVLTPLALALALSAPSAAAGPPPGDRIGRAVYVGDERIDDYRPQPSLTTTATSVERARHPAVDMHCHWDLEEDPRVVSSVPML